MNFHNNYACNKKCLKSEKKVKTGKNIEMKKKYI